MDSKINAFTLIELAIVIVIIGLIIGGVMVGNDMVRSSQLRATLSQIEKYNAAVNTFRGKYNGIPGDLKYSEAKGFGLYSITYAGYMGYPGYGDGDGIIRSANGSATPSTVTNLYGEPLIFWRHLSDAQLINGKYGTALNSAAEAVGISGLDAMNTFLPAAKLLSSTIAAGSPRDGKNYFLLAKVLSTLGVGAFGPSENPLTAYEAFNMDSKIDDGLPGSGTIFAIDATIGLNSPTTWRTLSAVAGCVASSAYALAQTTQSCSLRFSFQ